MMHDMACNSRQAIAGNNHKAFRVLHTHVNSRWKNTVGQLCVCGLVGLHAFRAAIDVLDGFIRSGWIASSRQIRSQTTRWIPARVSRKEAIHSEAKQASVGNATSVAVSSHWRAAMLHLHLASDPRPITRSVQPSNGVDS